MRRSIRSTDASTDTWTVAGRTFSSRLIIGTGKYKTYAENAAALEASGAEIVTVAVRRERLIDAAGNNLLDFIDTNRYTLLPNTAGCFNAEDAVRVARLGRDLPQEFRRQVDQVAPKFQTPVLEKSPGLGTLMLRG